MALYYPDRGTLASYCADHGIKSPFSVQSLLIKVPFSLITSQLVEVTGCASFPSCSYKDRMSFLIMKCVKFKVADESQPFKVVLENKQGGRARKRFSVW